MYPPSTTSIRQQVTVWTVQVCIYITSLLSSTHVLLGTTQNVFSVYLHMIATESDVAIFRLVSTEHKPLVSLGLDELGSLAATSPSTPLKLFTVYYPGDEKALETFVISSPQREARKRDALLQKKSTFQFLQEDQMQAVRDDAARQAMENRRLVSVTSKMYYLTNILYRLSTRPFDPMNVHLRLAAVSNQSPRAPTLINTLLSVCTIWSGGSAAPGAWLVCVMIQTRSPNSRWWAFVSL